MTNYGSKHKREKRIAFHSKWYKLNARTMRIVLSPEKRRFQMSTLGMQRRQS